MTYFGVYPGGTEVALGQPVQVRLSREEDVPADGFTGVFPLAGTLGSITGIRVYDRNHNLCFDGIVDVQAESDSDARLLTLTARSSAALLLDNEALPQTYYKPSLAVIFANHVRPYGFSAFRGNEKMAGGALTVTKGMSEWQAASAFCTQYLNVKPRIVNGVFDATGEVPKGSVRFGGTGVPYSSLIIENKYSEIVSELMAQAGGNGAYVSAAKERDAAGLGIRRRRCLSVGQNAESVLRAARKKSFSGQIACPGEVPALLLQAAGVEGKRAGFPGDLYISEIEYILNSSGEITRFVLRR